MKGDGDYQQVRDSNREFRLLEQEHLQLERELSQLLRRKILTPAEEIQKKWLQKRKLAAKDRMEEIVRG